MKDEIYNRIGRFQKELRDHGIGSALIVEKTDLYYLSGTRQDAHLFVPAEGSPLLMVKKDFDRAVFESPLERSVPLSGYSGLTEMISGEKSGLPQSMGLEMDVLPADLYLMYQRFFEGSRIVDISRLIRHVRMVKSPYEIACISKASKLSDDMYRKVPEFLKEAQTELELAIMVEDFYRRRGHPGVIRTRGFNLEGIYGHIMAGENTAVPSSSPGPTGGKGLGPFFSQGPSTSPIRRHSPILMDYCAGLDAYVSDSTRIFSLGKLDGTLTRAHEVMIEVQETLAQNGHAGALAEDLYSLALDMVEKAGLGDGFMGYPLPVPFVGHGVGLELDEWPIIGKGSRIILEPGMVIALEPKVVFPGNCAVGIENTFVVTESGMKKTNRYPDAVMVC